MPKSKPKPSTPAASRKTSRKPPSRAPKRQRRSSEDVLNRIVQAASEEFSRCGFAGTTTAAIARRAGVTEAQLFRYFGSKSNLFRETIFKPLDQHLMNFVSEHLPRNPDDVEQSSILYIDALQKFITAHAEALTSLIVAQTYDDGTAHGVGRMNSLRAYFDHGAATMTKTQSRPQVAPELMVRVSFVAVLAAIIFKDWILPAGLASDEEISAAINRFVLEGIGANFSKGRRSSP